MTPREGEAVGVTDAVGPAGVETITDWVPAVLPLEHMTTTV